MGLLTVGPVEIKMAEIIQFRERQYATAAPNRVEAANSIPPIPTDDPEKMIRWAIRYLQLDQKGEMV